jgi:ABC-type Fe3+ transport system substrate-binding protein
MGPSLSRRERGYLAFALALTFLLFALPAHADWQDGAGADWRRLLEAGRKEGKVVVAGRPDLAVPMGAAFKRDTGIAIDYLGGEGREQLTRLAREMRAHQITIDVIFGGQGMVPFVNDGFMKPIKPQLVLPSVVDAQYWLGGQLKWVDKDGLYLFEAAEYVHGWPLWNSDLVKQGEITSWQDLMKPQYKGKIASFDPRINGPGQAAASYLADLFGIDFIHRLYSDQQVVLSSTSRQMVEWVQRGTHLVALGVVPPDIEYFRQANVKTLVVGSLADGPGALLGGSSVVAEPKDAPNPNAAAVFLNWYASQPGQALYSAIWKIPSRRTDVSLQGIPDYTVPKQGVAYIDQYTEQWYVERYLGKYQSALVEALGGR